MLLFFAGRARRRATRPAASSGSVERGLRDRIMGRRRGSVLLRPVPARPVPVPAVAAAASGVATGGTALLRFSAEQEKTLRSIARPASIASFRLARYAWPSAVHHPDRTGHVQAAHDDGDQISDHCHGSLVLLDGSASEIFTLSSCSRNDAYSSGYLRLLLGVLAAANRRL